MGNFESTLPASETEEIQRQVIRTWCKKKTSSFTKQGGITDDQMTDIITHFLNDVGIQSIRFRQGSDEDRQMKKLREDAEYWHAIDKFPAY